MFVDIDDFLTFEKKTNIFTIKNDKGIFLWDILRYFVYNQLRKNYYETVPKKKSVSMIIRYIISSIQPLFFFFISRKKYENLFFFNSRNQYENSFIDQNQFDTYNILAEHKNCIIETCLQKDYSFYRETPISYGNLTRVIYRLCRINISKSDKECIEKIYQLLEQDLSELPFTKQSLVSILKKFYMDFFLWSHILRKHQIERIFLTQNGIQKGCFYSANQLHIPLYEFQHGVIGKGHLSYSYPDIDNIENYIYIPHKLLTLSSYWCETFNCPIHNQSIGNNFFSKPVKKNEDNNKILVISADVFGKQLASILREALNVGVLNPKDLIFKLHPNQYYEKSFFMDYFEGNVAVLTNEKSVNTLLAESKCMITVCSTAAYEALQFNTRVLIYAINMYKEMESIFTDRNVFLFSNIDELKIGLQADLPLDYKTPVFFDKCTPEKIKAAIDE